MTTKGEKPKMMVENISCILPESESMGGLFLGNVYGAQNPQILKEYGIRAVLTTSIETPIQYKKEDIPFHMVLRAHDKDNYSILESLDECIQFIHIHRNYTNVFVHCYAGVSRSATVIIAYLMKKLKWNFPKSLDFTKCKRIVTKPNDGFMRQLQEYERILNKDSTLKPKLQNFETLQNLSMNTTKVIQGQRVGIQTKRHKETPLPKILTVKSQSLSKVSVSKRVQKSKEKERVYVEKKESTVNGRSQGIMLRPKDLPGYKNF